MNLEEAPEVEEDLYVTVDGRRVDLIPDEAAPLTMLPVEERYFILDLSSYFPQELKAVDISDLLEKLSDRYGNVTGDPNQVAAWAKWSYYDEAGNFVNENDGYALIGSEKVLDLSPGERNYSNQISLELIIGRADPLDRGNLRYIIRINTLYLRNMFDFTGLNGVEINHGYYLANSNLWNGKGEMQLRDRKSVV